MGFSAMREECQIGVLFGILGTSAWGSLSCLRSSGRISSSYSEKVGVDVEFFRISFRDDGSVSVWGREW